MKVCYVDESGNQSTDPCLVMVGLLVDAARLNRTREELGKIFDDMESLFGQTLNLRACNKTLPEILRGLVSDRVVYQGLGYWNGLIC